MCGAGRGGGGRTYLAVGAGDVNGPPGEGVLQEAHKLVDSSEAEVDHGMVCVCVCGWDANCCCCL